MSPADKSGQSVVEEEEEEEAVQLRLRRVLIERNYFEWTMSFVTFLCSLRLA